MKKFHKLSDLYYLKKPSWYSNVLNEKNTDERINNKDERIKYKDEGINYKDERIKYKDERIKYKDERIKRINSINS